VPDVQIAVWLGWKARLNDAPPNFFVRKSSIIASRIKFEGRASARELGSSPWTEFAVLISFVFYRARAHHAAKRQPHLATARYARTAHVSEPTVVIICDRGGRIGPLPIIYGELRSMRSKPSGVFLWQQALPVVRPTSGCPTRRGFPDTTN
jgi:hypothetical protein